MAAGLGFKTFNTGDILSASDTNGYLMQGVLVFASAAARDAAITSPQEGQFAYLKDTNVTTYYTGSAWANLDTTGMTNPMTTTGDTIYSSSGSTPARLGIGSTGQVLTVAGGVPSWATAAGGGGMTLLSTTTLSGTSTTLSSISQDYVDLYFVLTNCSTTGVDSFKIRPNNDTGSNYLYSYVATNNGSLSTEYNNGATFGFFSVTPITTTQRYKVNGTGRIPRYTSTETKIIQSTSALELDGASTRMYTGQTNHALNSAITSITFVHDTIVSGTLYMYGVK